MTNRLSPAARELLDQLCAGAVLEVRNLHSGGCDTPYAEPAWELLEHGYAAVERPVDDVNLVVVSTEAGEQFVEAAFIASIPA